MIIHYSPYFDGSSFIDFSSRGNTILEELFVGDAGLLAELELRSGKSKIYPTQIEREANYFIVVKHYMQANPNCLFSESFKVDEYGVSSQLLNWRDELILSGWNANIMDVSAKLEVLTCIEDYLREEEIPIQGINDRWQNILQTEEQLLGIENEIIIHYKEEHLSPFIVALLKKIQNQGITCTFSYPMEAIAPKGSNLYKIQEAILNDGQLNIDPDDHTSFRIAHFDEQTDALEWIVNQPYHDNTVFINSDNRSFDNIQSAFEQPQSGSAIQNANPEIVQLFKLGCSLFLKPLNVYSLLSYLQVSVHPLPFSLRSDLIKVIIDQGGIINDDWKKVLQDFDSPKKLRFLPLKQENIEGVSKKTLTEYVKDLESWAISHRAYLSSQMPEQELVLQQLSTLTDFCHALIIILNDYPDASISNDSLKSWILSIYNTSSYPKTTAQQGSRLIIGSPAGIIDPVKEVIWIDCYGEMPGASAYMFLSNKEKEVLIQRGLLLWSEEDQVKAQMYAHKWPILMCKERLTLIASKKDKGETLNTHPLIIQLQVNLVDIAHVELKNPEPEAEIENIQKVALMQPAIQVEVGKKLFTPRASESYSSLSTLIQNPLDYVLEYQAKLRGNSVTQIAALETTLGNVAHQLIELMIARSNNDLEAIKILNKESFDDLFNEVVLQRGAILLLEENKIQCTRFKKQLGIAIGNLLEIIELNRLSILGCEVQEEMTDGPIPMNARIDMLLIDQAGKYMIFDMKWSSSKTYHQKLITANRALQLAVYDKIIEQAHGIGSVQCVGFFVLTLGTLFTTTPLLGANVKIITEQDNTNDIFEQAINAYRYRWGQLNEGIIEMAESALLDDIPYFVDSENQNLYPLEPDYSNAAKKVVNGFSNFSTFKGILK